MLFLVRVVGDCRPVNYTLNFEDYLRPANLFIELISSFCGWGSAASPVGAGGVGAAAPLSGVLLISGIGSNDWAGVCCYL